METLRIPDFIIVAALCVSVLTVVWPSCLICRRAGFSPWLGLLMIVPIGNIVLLWFLALAQWPAANTRGVAG